MAIVNHRFIVIVSILKNVRPLLNLNKILDIWSLKHSEQIYFHRFFSRGLLLSHKKLIISRMEEESLLFLEVSQITFLFDVIMEIIISWFCLKNLSVCLQIYSHESELIRVNEPEKLETKKTNILVNWTALSANVYWGWDVDTIESSAFAKCCVCIVMLILNFLILLLMNIPIS